MSADDCSCDFDGQSQQNVIWGLAIPLIILFQALNVLGAVNIYRFCKIKGFTKSLLLIYTFSFLE